MLWGYAVCCDAIYSECCCSVLRIPRCHLHTCAPRGRRLRLVNIVLETGGEALGGVPSLVRVCQTQLCKFLVRARRRARALCVHVAGPAQMRACT